MFLQPYLPHELQFAYSYRVFLRLRTHKFRRYETLASLQRSVLRKLLDPYSVRVLELSTDPTDLLTTLSLLPVEPISAAVSKVKGRVSKWLREAMHLDQPADLLSRGYFACTVGNSRRREVERYLTLQAAHHGYLNRALPPIYENHFRVTEADLARVSPKHGVVVAQFHIVLATAGRKGVFGSAEGERITMAWRQSLQQCALIKVSFVPDHVHLTLRAHPALAPSDIVLSLMNSAQEVIGHQLVRAGLQRLWQPSAYIGSYGDLASAQLRRYIEQWNADPL